MICPIVLRTYIPMIIGLTHVDCPNAWNAENIALALGYGCNQTNYPPIIRVNANESASIIQGLMTLLQQLIPSDIASFIWFFVQ